MIYMWDIINLWIWLSVEYDYLWDVITRGTWLSVECDYLWDINYPWNMSIYGMWEVLYIKFYFCCKLQFLMTNQRVYFRPVSRHSVTGRQKLIILWLFTFSEKVTLVLYDSFFFIIIIITCITKTKEVIDTWYKSRDKYKFHKWSHRIQYLSSCFLSNDFALASFKYS